MFILDTAIAYGVWTTRTGSNYQCDLGVKEQGQIDFVTFPFGILGQVWYLIVSIADHCCLSTSNNILVQLT